MSSDEPVSSAGPLAGENGVEISTGVESSFLDRLQALLPQDRPAESELMLLSVLADAIARAIDKRLGVSGKLTTAEAGQWVVKALCGDGPLANGATRVLDVFALTTRGPELLEDTSFDFPGEQPFVRRARTDRLCSVVMELIFGNSLSGIAQGQCLAVRMDQAWRAFGLDQVGRHQPTEQPAEHAQDPAPRLPSREEQAVAYCVEWKRSGGRGHTKATAEKFGVTRRTIQRWHNEVNEVKQAEKQPECAGADLATAWTSAPSGKR